MSLPVITQHPSRNKPGVNFLYANQATKKSCDKGISLLGHVTL